MMFDPMLSAEQQAVVDGTPTNAFWEHWADRHENHSDTTENGYPIVRCRSAHYVVKPWKAPERHRAFGGGSMLGHGGRLFVFQMEDGTQLRSNDVWYQGVIPLAYRRRLPDNAESAERDYSEFQPWGTPEEATLAGLSMFEHPTQAVDFTKVTQQEIIDGTAYTTVWDEEHRRDAPLAESQVWSSTVINVPQPPPGGLPSLIGTGSFQGQMNEDGTAVVHRFGHGGPKGTSFNGRMQQVQDGWHTVMLDIDQPVRLVPSTTPGHWHLYIDVAMPWWRYRKLLKALKNAGIIEPGYYSASVARRCTALRLPWVKKEDLQPKRDEEDPF